MRRERVTGTELIAPTCRQCGAVFTPPPGNVRKGFGFYCSKECHGQYKQEQNGRVTVRCPWIGCDASTEVFRSQQPEWGGRPGRSAVFCSAHRAVVKELTGSPRMNGFGRIFVNVDRIYLTRSAESRALRVVIFEQYKRSCGACHARLVFAEQGT